MENIYDQTIKIPEGIHVKTENNTLEIKGKGGSETKKFINPRLEITVENNELNLRLKKNHKASIKDKTFINSLVSVIKSIFYGIENGYDAKLKICSGHFPMNVSIQDHTIIIKNFLGEKVPRKAVLNKDVNIKVNGDIIEITGINKEKVGQAAARIEQLTRITNKDRRVFQDGCYITEKPRIIKNE